MELFCLQYFYLAKDQILNMKKANWTQWILIACLGVGAFLRLYNFTNTLQFLGDQGRDATIAKEILIDHNPVLIGPVTSTGNMYLGPLYYYFMVPFLAMSYPSPVGPAYAIALLSILTIALVYYLGKEMVGEKAALSATILTSLSATLVYFAHFSWNPNPSPIMAVLLIWATYRAITKHPKYWILVGLCVAVLVQLHYITLLCLPAAGLIWLNQLRVDIKNRKANIISGLVALGVFIVSFLPLVLFDLRHNFINSQSFIHFLTADLGPNQSSLLDRVHLVATRTFLRINQTLFFEFMFPNIIASCLFIAGLIATVIVKLKNSKSDNLGLSVILTYLVIGILGLGYYRGAIFNHYLIYLLPLSFLVWGVVLEFLIRKNLGKIFVIVFGILFLSWNITRYHLSDLGWTVQDVQKTSQSILSHRKDNEKYNIVLLSETGDIEGQSYRYFLNVSDHPPLPKQNWGDIDTLFIINEDHKLKKVVDSPIYEIVVFPNKTPAEVYTIPGGPEITVLRRNP